jgi:hypothetical protein
VQSGCSSITTYADSSRLTKSWRRAHSSLSAAAPIRASRCGSLARQSQVRPTRRTSARNPESILCLH